MSSANASTTVFYGIFSFVGSPTGFEETLEDDAFYDVEWASEGFVARRFEPQKGS